MTTRPIRIAHLSDLHLGPLPRPRPWQLISKRVFGFITWHRHRRSARGMAMLEALVADCHAAKPDLIVITGDFVNIALPQEFAQAKAWLNARFAPHNTMAILGNHDAYVPGALAAANAAFAEFLSGEPGAPLPTRRVGGVSVLGVSTAVPRWPHLSSGVVGKAQRERLADALRREADTFKIVLIHHPPDCTLAKGRRGLDDCDLVRTVLAEGDADLVLHGHNHRPSLVDLPVRSGAAPMVGVESASSDGTRKPPAAFNIYEIRPDTGAVTMERRIAEGNDVARLPAVTIRRGV